MKKKLIKTDQTQSGSYSKFKAYFLFDKTDKWWDRYLPGYTHVSVLIGDHTCALYFEPQLTLPLLKIYRDLSSYSIDAYRKEFEACVECTIQPVERNNLLRPILQTCTTLVQYLCGISLGCITAQGLYKCLTAKDGEWLRKKGILEVKVWPRESEKLSKE